MNVPIKSLERYSIGAGGRGQRNPRPLPRPLRSKSRPLKLTSFRPPIETGAGMPRHAAADNRDLASGHRLGSELRRPADHRDVSSDLTVHAEAAADEDHVADQPFIDGDVHVAAEPHDVADAPCGAAAPNPVPRGGGAALQRRPAPRGEERRFSDGPAPRGGTGALAASSATAVSGNRSIGSHPGGSGPGVRRVDRRGDAGRGIPGRGVPGAQRQPQNGSLHRNVEKPQPEQRGGIRTELVGEPLHAQRAFAIHVDRLAPELDQRDAPIVVARQEPDSAAGLGHPVLGVDLVPQSLRPGRLREQRRSHPSGTPRVRPARRAAVRPVRRYP